MSLFVNQEKYLIANKKDSIGSFGAGHCTILMLFNEQTKLCAHLDALTDELIFNFEIRKFLIGKDKSKIDIILTSSGLYDNFTLRSRILGYIRKLGLDKNEIVVEGTRIVLNSNNEIETDFEPKQKFDLSNMDKSLEKELLEKAEKLKILVAKFALSRKHLPNVDEFGRQPTTNMHVRYNYSIASWIYYPTSNNYQKDFKSEDIEIISILQEMTKREITKREMTKRERTKRERTKREMTKREQKYSHKPIISQMKSRRFKDMNHIQRNKIWR